MDININKMKTAEEKIKTIIGLINQVGFYNNIYGDIDVELNKNGFFAYIPTKERGARTDHGGGSDGDGWMSDEQVERLRQFYIKQFQPKMDSLKETFTKNGFKTDVYLEYGEKGHVSIQLNAIKK